MIRIGLVADDLTGACDSALPFLAGGPVLVGLWPHVPSGDLVCAAVSTETRDQPGLAAARGRVAAVRVGGDLLYRKLDSLLRGAPVADLESVRMVTGGRCLVAPALPGEGRTTAGSVQRWPGGEADLRVLLGPLVAEGHVERGRPGSTPPGRCRPTRSSGGPARGSSTWSSRCTTTRATSRSS